MQAVSTEWLWPWHPDIHWYHPYLNLSSVGPEIWDGLHLGLLVGRPKYNISNPAFGWISQVFPNFTAVNLVYKEQYEGTAKNMLFCLPQIYGKYPDCVKVCPWCGVGLLFSYLFFTRSEASYKITLLFGLGGSR